MIARGKAIESEILTGQFIPDHVFVYIARGMVHCYDGNKNYFFKAGEYFVPRKNRRARYKIENTAEGFERVMFCYDQPFLKQYCGKHPVKASVDRSADTFIKVEKTELVDNFIGSLKPYLKNDREFEDLFEELKYEELLIILLKKQPALAGILFDFRMPEKIDFKNL